MVIHDPQLARPVYEMNPRPLHLITDLVWHHTAGPTTQGVHDIDREHRERGFAMIGYNFIIKPDGTTFFGRPVDVVPAAALGRNRESINLCCIGNFQSSDAGYTGPPTDPQVAAAIKLTVALHHSHPGIVRTIGHRDVARLLVNLGQIAESEMGDYSTACPGDMLAAKIGAAKLAAGAAMLERL